MKEELASPADPFALILCHLFLLRGRSPCKHIQAVKTSGLLTQLFFSSQGKQGQLALHKKRWEVGERWWGGVSLEFGWGFCRFENSQCHEVSCYLSAGWYWGGMRWLFAHPCFKCEEWCMCVSVSGCGYHTLKKTFQPKDHLWRAPSFSEKEKYASFSSIEQM